MTQPLTTKQSQMLDAIRAAIESTGYPPSVRDLGKAVGLASTSSVISLLRGLEEAGYIERSSHARGLTIVNPVSPAARALLDAADEVAEIERIGKTRVKDMTPEEALLFAESPLNDVRLTAAGLRPLFEQWLRDRATAS